MQAETNGLLLRNDRMRLVLRARKTRQFFVEAAVCAILIRLLVRLTIYNSLSCPPPPFFYITPLLRKPTLRTNSVYAYKLFSTLPYTLLASQVGDSEKKCPVLI